jgi:hypothetical protein
MKLLEAGLRAGRLHSGVQAWIAETFPAYRRAGSLGENAVAGQECPAYRVFEIAAFIPTLAYRPRSRPRAGQAGTGQGILQHFRNRFCALNLSIG